MERLPDFVIQTIAILMIGVASYLIFWIDRQVKRHGSLFAGVGAASTCTRFLAFLLGSLVAGFCLFAWLGGVGFRYELLIVSLALIAYSVGINSILEVVQTDWPELGVIIRSALTGKAHSTAKQRLRKRLGDSTALIESQPGNAKAHYDRALVYYRLYDHERAIADLQAYLRLARSDDEPRWTHAERMLDALQNQYFPRSRDHHS